MKSLNQLSYLFVTLIIFSCDTNKPTEKLSTTTAQETDSLLAGDSIELIPAPLDSIKKVVAIDTLAYDSLALLAIASDSLHRDSLLVEEEGHFAIVPDQLKKMGIDQMSIPTVGEIGIGTYPRSYIVKLGDSFKYKEKLYKTMEMVSEDGPEAVLEFYKNRRENWFYVEKGGVHTFKREENAYFRETNNLQIQPFNYTKHPGVDSLFDFQPKSFIYIYYEVKE